MIREINVRPLFVINKQRGILRSREGSIVDMGCPAEADRYFLLSLGRHCRVCTEESLKEQMDYIIENLHLQDIFNKLKE